MFSGKVDIDEVGAAARTCTIEREGFETVGGYLLSHLGRVPAVGERFDIDGLHVEVLEVERRRIHKVRICAPRARSSRRSEASPSCDEVRLRLAHRPAERRQVDAAQPAGRHKLAIVSDKPQTTRTRILGVQNYPDAQVVFLDTPGIHRPLHRMNVRMVDAAVDTIGEVDVLGLVVDATEPPGKGDQFVARPGARTCTAPVVPDPQQDRSRARSRSCCRSWSGTGRRACSPRSCPVSAATGENVDRLERLLIDRLPEGRAAVSGRLPDRPARAVLRRRDRPREAAAVHARRDSVLERRRRRPVRGADRRAAGCCGCTARSWSTASRRSRSSSAGAATMIKRIGTAAREELERFFDDEGLPRPARPGEVGVARGRPTCSANIGMRPRTDWSSAGACRQSSDRMMMPACWMPLYTTDALILRTYKLGESDRIVVFLTRDRGKKRGVAKNARQSRRRFGGGARADDVRARRRTSSGAARAGAA